MFGPLDHPVGDSSSRGAAQRTGVCRPIYGLCIGVQAGLGPCRPGSSRLASLLDIFPCLLTRCVLDLVMAQKDGKYLIVKDPNKAMIR